MKTKQLMSFDISGGRPNELPFSSLFQSGKPDKFIGLLENAFIFAYRTGQTIKKVHPKPDLEVLDQAIKYWLLMPDISHGQVFADGVEFLLEEKGAANNVWRNGICVFKRDVSSFRRRWTMPDGIIQSKTMRVAVEFDHGNDVGKWANQLYKGIRVTYSDKIDGLLYCFSWYGAVETFNLKDLTDEFVSLISTVARKPIGIITFFIGNIDSKYMPDDTEIVRFLEQTYVSPKGVVLKSMINAQNIIKRLREK